MAKKAKKVVRISKLARVTEELEQLRDQVRQYFIAVRAQYPESFSITLPAKTDDKDTMIRVSSLMSSVLTGAGLGMEVRLVAEPTPTGGTLYVRFYKPVPKNGLDQL